MDRRSELFNSLDELTKAVTALNEKIEKEYLNLLETLYDQEDERPVMLAINHAAQATGASAYEVRKCAKNGTISAVRAGVKIFVNMKPLTDFMNNSRFTGIQGKPEEISISLQEEYI